MKKIFRIILIVSILMIAGFTAFLFKMNESSKKLKDEIGKSAEKESGIVSLQGENYSLNIPSTTEIKDLIIAGDNVNVLIFEAEGATDIYTTEHTQKIKQQLERMQLKKEYTFEAPLLAYNPYGTNTCGIYIYFKTEEVTQLEYTVSVPDENIPDFSRTMKENSLHGKNEYEYLITGFIPGMENYLKVRLLSDSGKEIKTMVYRINMPASPFGNPSNIVCEYVKEKKSITNGLYYLYKNGTGSIPAYDNAGYLREEIPLIEDNELGIAVAGASMYIVPSYKKIAKLSMTGEVMSVADTGKYTLSTDVAYNGVGNALAVASKDGRKTKGDIVLKVDFETLSVNEIIDFRDKLKGYYKKHIKKSKISDWLGINGLEVFNKNDVLISAGAISSIINVQNVMTENPIIKYIIGDPKLWDKAEMSDLLLARGEEEGEEEEESILKKEDIFELVSQTGVVPYVTIDNKTLYDEEGNYVPVESYYLSVINNNGGANELLRIKIDEAERTYLTANQVPIENIANASSITAIGANFVINEQQNNLFQEISVDGQTYNKMHANAQKVEKLSMKGYWFK